MEHLRRAGLVAGAVVEEALELGLRLLLALDLTGGFEALSARDRGPHGRQVGNLFRLKGSELVAGLGRLQSACRALARRDERIDLCPSRIEVLHDAGVPCGGKGIPVGGGPVSCPEAAKQAKWGEYANWALADTQEAMAIGKVYQELEGKLK